MPKPIHVVLDTNILISATLARQGFPARILLAALDKALTLIISRYVLAEYLDVLRRPHIVKKYPNLAERAEA